MVLTDLLKMELREVPAPGIRTPDDVLIRIGAVGVCGSDVHYYTTGRIGSQEVVFPFPVGHECSGTVEAVGEAVQRVRVGDKVAVDPLVACPSDSDSKCDQCLSGRQNTCRCQTFLGCPGQVDGCLGEYLVMPEESCYPVAPSTSLQEAALVEPLSVGIYAAKSGLPIEGCSVAILGAGPIGLSTLLPVIRYNPRSVYVTDRLDYRLDVAAAAGVDWTGNIDRDDITSSILAAEAGGVDCVFECCGQQDAIDQALSILRPGGKLVIIGIPQTERLSFRAEDMRRREITIINIRRQRNCVQDAIDMVQDPEIDTSFMITHRFSLQDTKEAFDMVADYQDGVIKAMICVEQGSMT